MRTTTVHQRLKSEVDLLPDDIASEVFDFLLFVKERRAEEAFLWQQVEATHKYRQQHPEDVMTVTAEEFDKLTAYMDDEPA